MEDDLSTDAVRISPSLPAEDIACADTRSLNDELLSKQYQPKKNNYLQLSKLDRSWFPERLISTQSENEFEDLVHSAETHDSIQEHGNETDIKGPHVDFISEDTTDENKYTSETPGASKTHQLQLQKDFECSGLILDKENPRQKNLCLPPKPPLEWRLNVLLDGIAENVAENELKRVKLMFSGPQGIGKKVLEKCKTWTDLFTVLKQGGYISRDNILYLSKILYTLGRKDLIKRTVQYCLDEEGVLYYYSDDGDIGTERRKIKIHVKGDVQTYNRRQLVELLYITASIVCIPPEEIQIIGVEPGSSFLITFTMPNMYVDILKDLLEQEMNIQRLIALDVDVIIIDEKQYDISGGADPRAILSLVERVNPLVSQLCSPSGMKVSQQYIEIMNVYQQLEAKRKEFDKLQLMHLNCRKELSDARNQLGKVESLENKVALLEKKNYDLTIECSKLKIEKRPIQFEMKFPSDDFHSISEEFLFKRHHTKLKMNEREDDEFELRCDLANGVKTAEDVLVERHRLFLSDLNLSLNLESAEALKILSKRLSDDQRTTLMNMYLWSRDDFIKTCIDADNQLLLLGLKCKEATSANMRVPNDTILDRFGRVLGLDLQREYKAILQQMKIRKKLQETCRAYIDEYEHTLAE